MTPLARAVRGAVPPVRRLSAHLATLLLAAAILASGANAPRAADAILGEYTVRGWEAGQNPAADTPYTGAARLIRRGGAIEFRGSVDGDAYAGIGLFDEASGMLALQYLEVRTGKIGVAHFRVLDGRLEGSWVWMSDEQGRLGREIWTPKK